MKKLLIPLLLALSPLASRGAIFEANSLLAVPALQISNTVPVTNNFLCFGTIQQTNITGLMYTNSLGILFLDTNGPSYGTTSTNGQGCITNDVTSVFKDVRLWSDANGNVSTNWSLNYKMYGNTTVTGFVFLVTAPIYNGPMNSGSGGSSGFNGPSIQAYVGSGGGNTNFTAADPSSALVIGSGTTELITNFIPCTNNSTLGSAQNTAQWFQGHLAITVPGGTKGLRPIMMFCTNATGQVWLTSLNVSGYVP